jgi:hypothetical protein
MEGIVSEDAENDGTTPGEVRVCGADESRFSAMPGATEMVKSNARLALAPSPIGGVDGWVV